MFAVVSTTADKHCLSSGYTAQQTTGWITMISIYPVRAVTWMKFLRLIDLATVFITMGCVVYNDTGIEQKLMFV